VSDERKNLIDTIALSLLDNQGRTLSLANLATVADAILARYELVPKVIEAPADWPATRALRRWLVQWSPRWRRHLRPVRS